MNLKIGDKVINKEVTENFLCSNQGGIRKSKKTKTIVIFAKFNNCSYKHRWDKDVLYFTGMGKKGNQEMKRQNKSLLNAKDEGFAIHLFEVYDEKGKEFIYEGEVELISEPIIEKQLDDEKEEREVFIFPFKRK